MRRAVDSWAPGTHSSPVAPCTPPTALRAARRAQGSSPLCRSCRPPSSSRWPTRRRRRVGLLNWATASCCWHTQPAAGSTQHRRRRWLLREPCTPLPPTASHRPTPPRPAAAHRPPLPRSLPAPFHRTCLQVRQKGAHNLGNLARLSMRADQLVAGEPTVLPENASATAAGAAGAGAGREHRRRAGRAVEQQAHPPSSRLDSVVCPPTSPLTPPACPPFHSRRPGGRRPHRGAGGAGGLPDRPARWVGLHCGWLCGWLAFVLLVATHTRGPKARRHHTPPQHVCLLHPPALTPPTTPLAPARAGALLSAGDRLSGETVTKVGAALQAVTAGAGDDEELRAAAAGATGAYAKYCRWGGGGLWFVSWPAHLHVEGASAADSFVLKAGSTRRFRRASESCSTLCCAAPMSSRPRWSRGRLPPAAASWQNASARRRWGLGAGVWHWVLQEEEQAVGISEVKC